jgi:hypothetical protein
VFFQCFFNVLSKKTMFLSAKAGVRTEGPARNSAKPMFSLLGQPDKNFAMNFLQPARMLQQSDNSQPGYASLNHERPFNQPGITIKHALTSLVPPWQSIAGFGAFTFGAAPC